MKGFRLFANFYVFTILCVNISYTLTHLIFRFEPNCEPTPPYIDVGIIIASIAALMGWLRPDKPDRYPKKMAEDYLDKED